jgi:DNA-binding MarR family transcriptional regulator
MNFNRGDMQELTTGLLGVVREIQMIQDSRLDRISFEMFQLLVKYQQVRPSDLAAMLHFNPSSVTRRIQSLKQSGLVAVETDPEDQRSCLISLTEAGTAELLRVENSILDELTKMLADWSKEELEQFTSSLGLFSRGLQQLRHSNQPPPQSGPGKED